MRRHANTEEKKKLEKKILDVVVGVVADSPTPTTTTEGVPVEVAAAMY